jgi:hypothetical protein
MAKEYDATVNRSGKPQTIWWRSSIIPVAIVSVIASGACTLENLQLLSQFQPWIPAVPALVLVLSAIRARVAGLAAVAFAAPLYAIGLRLQMNLHDDDFTLAAVACGVTVLLGVVGAVILWRSETRKAVALSKLAIGGFGAAAYVAIVLLLNPING